MNKLTFPIVGNPFNLVHDDIAFLQSAIRDCLGALSRIGGNLYRLTGVVKSPDGTTVSAGWIVIDGEVFEFRACAYNDKIIIVDETGDGDEERVRYFICRSDGTINFSDLISVDIPTLINIVKSHTTELNAHDGEIESLLATISGFNAILSTIYTKTQQDLLLANKADKIQFLTDFVTHEDIYTTTTVITLMSKILSTEYSSIKMKLSFSCYIVASSAEVGNSNTAIFDLYINGNIVKSTYESIKDDGASHSISFNWCSDYQKNTLVELKCRTTDNGVGMTVKDAILVYDAQDLN